MTKDVDNGKFEKFFAKGKREGMRPDEASKLDARVQSYVSANPTPSPESNPAGPSVPAGSVASTFKILPLILGTGLLLTSVYLVTNLPPVEDQSTVVGTLESVNLPLSTISTPGTSTTSTSATITNTGTSSVKVIDTPLSATNTVKNLKSTTTQDTVIQKVINTTVSTSTATSTDRLNRGAL